MVKMNSERYQEIVEASWRRSLTPSEEAELQLHLAANPEQQAEWEDDLALSHAMANLREAPVASNFTAQVLSAIDREVAGERASRKGIDYAGWFRRWFPQLATASVLLITGLTGLNFYQAHTRTQTATEFVATVSSFTAALPAPDVFEDFETIQQLHTAPEFSDAELVNVLLR